LCRPVPRRQERKSAMKTHGFIVAALLGLAAVAPTAGQTTQTPQGEGAGRPPTSLGPTPLAVNPPADVVAEEVEIMRRLLDRTLATRQHAAPAAPWTTLSPNLSFPPYTQWGDGLTNRAWDPNTRIPVNPPWSTGLINPYGTTWNSGTGAPWSTGSM